MISFQNKTEKALSLQGCAKDFYKDLTGTLKYVLSYACFNSMKRVLKPRPFKFLLDFRHTVLRLCGGNSYLFYQPITRQKTSQTLKTGMLSSD